MNSATVRWVRWNSLKESRTSRKAKNSITIRLYRIMKVRYSAEGKKSPAIIATRIAILLLNLFEVFQHILLPVAKIKGFE